MAGAVVFLLSVSVSSRCPASKAVQFFFCSPSIWAVCNKMPVIVVFCYQQLWLLGLPSASVRRGLHCQVSLTISNPEDVFVFLLALICEGFHDVRCQLLVVTSCTQHFFASTSLTGCPPRSSVYVSRYYIFCCTHVVCNSTANRCNVDA